MSLVEDLARQCQQCRDTKLILKRMRCRLVSFVIFDLQTSVDLLPPTQLRVFTPIRRP